jgi:hypothetical protein
MLEHNNQRFRLRDLLGWRWNPTPLRQPKVDPDLESLRPLTRSAESIRYSILSFEFWLSPDGQIREWVKNHTRLAAVLSIPAFLVVPIITFALWQIVSWAAALISITGNLIIFPMLLLLAVVGLVITIQLLKALFGSR